MHAPNTRVPTDEKTVTLPNGHSTVATKAEILANADKGLVGHNQLLQTATRLGADSLDSYGRLHRTDLRTKLSDEQIGINSVMEATHRQNFLVPPRSRRSFPLAKLV